MLSPTFVISMTEDTPSRIKMATSERVHSNASVGVGREPTSGALLPLGLKLAATKMRNSCARPESVQAAITAGGRSATVSVTWTPQDSTTLPKSASWNVWGYIRRNAPTMIAPAQTAGAGRPATSASSPLSTLELSTALARMPESTRETGSWTSSGAPQNWMKTTMPS